MHIDELFTEQELHDALQLHREQLQRLGATLEDSISEMLQKMLDNYDHDEHIRHELLAIDHMDNPCESCACETVCGVSSPPVCNLLTRYNEWKQVKDAK